MSVDRSSSNSIHLTQRFLAYMMDVRRVSVTVAASALHKMKIVEYSRGTVKILDRPALEDRACRCYRADLESYNRLLGL